MNLADERLKQLDDPSLTVDERALLRCRAAAEFIQNGQYEAAGAALGEFWGGIGRRPNVEGLDGRVAAEVLQQVGALSGWMGGTQQAKGAQEAAKDLLSESEALFERSGEAAGAAFARADLGLCYWREGAYDEARILLTRALEELADADAERRATVLIRLAIVECAAGRPHNALGVLKQHEQILNDSENHYLRGGFHNIYAMTLRRLVLAGDSEYYDRAIIEYTAAGFHYELAGHESYVASVEINIAFLLYKLGRYADAHEHLNRAQAMFARQRDERGAAHVGETRARVLLAEKQYREAGLVIAGVIPTLEEGGESALLADALTVQGLVWARLGSYESSIEILRRAVDVAEVSGAISNAAGAAMALIEEHGARRAIEEGELYDLYRRADRLLKDSQDADEVARLRACARVVMRRLAGVQFGDKNFTLFGAIHEVEARLITQALDEAGGSVTRAARLLGVRHQTLAAMLQTRHKRLMTKRTPPEKRRRSIIKKPKKRAAPILKSTPETQLSGEG